MPRLCAAYSLRGSGARSSSLTARRSRALSFASSALRPATLSSSILPATVQEPYNSTSPPCATSLLLRGVMAGEVRVVGVLGRGGLADGEVQQQRGDVDARGQTRGLLGARAGDRARAAQVAHDQRHPDRLLVRARALAAHTVRGAVLAV